jgi:hypothetical protein
MKANFGFKIVSVIIPQNGVVIGKNRDALMNLKT